MPNSIFTKSFIPLHCAPAIEVQADVEEPLRRDFYLGAVSDRSDRNGAHRVMARRASRP
jgi:hypothetical protein